MKLVSNHRFRPIIAAALCLAFLTLACAGCFRTRNVHVTGTVKFADGTPLTIGQICFYDGYYLGRGDFDKDGRYELRMYRKNDGIPRGSYQVYIASALTFAKDDLAEIEKKQYKDEDDERYGTIRLGKVAKLVELVDRQYTNPDTSGWFVEVKKNSKFDFVVYPPGKVPEEEITDEARFQFDSKYREKKVKEYWAEKAKEAREEGDDSVSPEPPKPRLVNPGLL